jgi:hypothetical protein
VPFCDPPEDNAFKHRALFALRFWNLFPELFQRNLKTEKQLGHQNLDAAGRFSQQRRLARAVQIAGQQDAALRIFDEQHDRVGVVVGMRVQAGDRERTWAAVSTMARKHQGGQSNGIAETRDAQGASNPIPAWR